MSEYSINKKADEAIHKLITYSKWGCDVDIQSLTYNLENEVKELIHGIIRRDTKNCFEESADVLMLILCLLNKISPEEDAYISKVIALMIEKLHRRYKPIYFNSKKSGDLNLDEENEIWKLAKQEEMYSDLIFCPNPDCKYYCDIINAKIQNENGHGTCLSCNEHFEISKKCILLGEFRANRRKYFTQIATHLINFSNGDENAPYLLIEKEKAFDALVSYIVPEKTKLLAFIKFMRNNHSVSEDKTKAFIDTITTLPGSHSPAVVLFDSFINSLYEGVTDTKQLYSPSELKYIYKRLSMTKLPVIKVVEKNLQFSAKSWDNQIAKKLLLRYDENRIIECLIIVHFNGSFIRDLTFELSNMHGCPVGCAFCASGELSVDPLNLSALDFVKQLNVSIDESGYNPDEFEHFYVSFAGIGEPSLLYKEISIGMALIETLYPHVRFNIATIGFNHLCFEQWQKRNHNIRTIQIPYYSATIEKISKLVKNIPDNYSLKVILASAVVYKSTHPGCRIKVNYIVICGYNDSNEDIDELCALLGPFREEIEIKISYLNETRPSIEKGLSSPPESRMFEIQRLISNSGYSCYVFGTKNNPELGCGQLVQNFLLGEKQ